MMSKRSMMWSMPLLGLILVLGACGTDLQETGAPPLRGGKADRYNINKDLSCQDHCGDVTWDGASYCGCDEMCETYDDCCNNKVQQCDCQPVLCELYCPYGFKKDENGCEVCSCYIPAYDPCADKSCGDPCSICAPNDPDCVETAVFKACDANGTCIMDTLVNCCQPVICALYCEHGFKKDENGCEICACDEPAYDPCADKSCGDPCSLCDPNDPDCVETAVFKACDANGQCTMDTLVNCCQPVMCALYCEHGFKKDENGCEICACDEPMP